MNCKPKIHQAPSDILIRLTSALHQKSNQIWKYQIQTLASLLWLYFIQIWNLKFYSSNIHRVQTFYKATIWFLLDEEELC